MTEELTCIDITAIKVVNVICFHREDTALSILDRRVLLIKDPSYTRSLLKFPGGTIESHEDSKDAAVRELKQETGVELLPHELTQLFDQQRKDHRVRFFSGTADLRTASEWGDENGHPLRVYTELTLRGVLTELLMPHYRAVMDLVRRGS